MCNIQCMGKRTTFAVMMCLTTSFFFVEIIVGYMTNSMALVADSFHMLSDILSLIIGYFALKYSRKAPGSSVAANTYGFVRAEVLGALINSVFLLALCFSIFVESFKRMIELDTIKNPILVLIVGGVGLLINVIGLFLFQGHAHSHGGGGHTHGSHGGHGHSHHNNEKHGHSHDSPVENEQQIVLAKGQDDEIAHGKDVHPHTFINQAFRQESMENFIANVETDGFTTIDIGTPDVAIETVAIGEATKGKPQSGGQMNMKGVYLHILGDALGSVIVIIAALVIYFFDGKWTLYVDPGLSIVIVLIILKTTIPLLKESSKILLQYAPSHIQLSKLQEKMLVKFPVIKNIHEFHIWQLTGNKIIASVHIQFSSYTDYKSLASSIKEFFHHEGIHSTTIQPEFKEDLDNTDKQCLLQCIENSCEEKLCCVSTKKETKKSRKSKKKQSSATQENQDGVISANMESDQETHSPTSLTRQSSTSTRSIENHSDESPSVNSDSTDEATQQDKDKSTIEKTCSESTKL